MVVVAAPVTVPDELRTVPDRPQPPADFTAEAVARFMLDRGEDHVARLEAHIRALVAILEAQPETP